MYTLSDLYQAMSCAISCLSLSLFSTVVLSLGNWHIKGGRSTAEIQFKRERLYSYASNPMSICGL